LFNLNNLFTGILEREQEQSVVYGSIDFGKTVVTNDKYKELVGLSLNYFV
jgi:protein TIF31